MQDYLATSHYVNFEKTTFLAEAQESPSVSPGRSRVRLSHIFLQIRSLRAFKAQRRGLPFLQCEAQMCVQCYLIGTLLRNRISNWKLTISPEKPTEGIKSWVGFLTALLVFWLDDRYHKVAFHKARSASRRWPGDEFERDRHSISSWIIDLGKTRGVHKRNKWPSEIHKG